MPPNLKDISKESCGWVLYDGRCRFCLALVRLGGAWIRRHGFELAPLQSPWVQDRLGLPADELLQEMRLLTADNHLLGGVDALLYLARLEIWSWPLYALGQFSAIHTVMEIGYRWVARNRACWRNVCAR